MKKRMRELRMSELKKVCFSEVKILVFEQLKGRLYGKGLNLFSVDQTPMIGSFRESHFGSIEGIL